MIAQDSPVALVTGSGHGIGRAIALQLSADGFRVIVNGVSGDPADKTHGIYEVEETINAQGGIAAACKADISKAESREAMVDFIDKNFGRLDLLVNNAGIAPKERKDILDATEESFDHLLGINLKGPYFLTQLIANRMIQWKQKGIVPQPRIAFVTSISAYTSSPNRGEYCVSKAGLAMAAKLYADRLAEYGIPVLEIRPGIIHTRMTEKVTEKYDRLIGDGLLPQKRWGEPEDVAKAVSAFAQGYLDYSTGESIDVSGGFNLYRL